MHGLCARGMSTFCAGEGNSCCACSHVGCMCVGANLCLVAVELVLTCELLERQHGHDMGVGCKELETDLASGEHAWSLSGCWSAEAACPLV